MAALHPVKIFSIQNAFNNGVLAQRSAKDTGSKVVNRLIKSIIFGLRDDFAVELS